MCTCSKKEAKLEISACKLPGLVVAVCLLMQGPAAFAQQTPLQIKSFSVSPDQTLTYPDSSSGANQLAGFADDHTTFTPPAASGAPYLVFGGASAGASSGIWGAVVLQTTDLTTFDFAPGYNFPVLTSPNHFTECNPADDTEFDENYAAPGSVLQDPTLPAGNLIMIYHAENHCPGGVFQSAFYASVGFTRSSDNGRTWPAPESGALGGPSRYAVLQSEPQPTPPYPGLGDAAPSAFVDKSASGDYYLYAAYANFSSSGQAVRVARAQLGVNPLTFLKWHNDSFSEPGIGGLDSAVMPSTGCGSTSQTDPEISYNDDLGLYLMIFLCNSDPTGDAPIGGWYYSTATSLDLEDWTAPQLIQNSQYPHTLSCPGQTTGDDFDGEHLSTMSPLAASGHTKLTGYFFFTHITCDPALKQFLSRTFTIVAEPQGTPASLTITQGNGQSATANTAFALSLQVTVKDAGSNPIAGVVVTFTAPSSGVGGTFGGAASAMATTNTSGVATAPTFTADGTAGSYTVSATVPGVTTPASFTLTNVPGTAASLTITQGNAQGAAVATEFATPLQVVVKDSTSNPVAGVMVTFTAPSSGASGGFGGSITGTATSNGAGLATAPAFTANTIAGSYSVSAAAAGVAAVSFSLTNMAGAPRVPQGVYAVVDIKGNLSNPEDANCPFTSAPYDPYFNCLYHAILQDTAVAGLALQVHWDLLNPTATGPYFWNYVDDAFAQVLAWNTQNPNQPPKTIQLIVDPGFQSPTWLLDSIPPCDGLFATPVVTPPSDCGTVVFMGYQETPDNDVLPLPWNQAYQTAWQTFLNALAGRYLSNPAFVSISVAGPTASSSEITLPSDSTTNAGDNPQPQNGLAPNAMWRQLLAFQFPSQPGVSNPYLNSDQAFIDAWEQAIVMYGQIFPGITLTLATGNGLPNFNTNYTLPAAPFSNECPNPDMECAAVSTIVSYFAQSTVDTANAKATQTSGMEASRVVDGGNLGVAGAKCVSQATAQFTTPSTQILAGAQFNTRFSNDPVVEGCFADFPTDSSDTPPGCNLNGCTMASCITPNCIPSACLAYGVSYSQIASYSYYPQVLAKDPSVLIPPEQAEYNVMNVYFQGSPAAPVFGGTITPSIANCTLAGSPATAALNYLQIYSPDIEYAEANASAPATVVVLNGNNPVTAPVSITAQTLLNMASTALGQISELPLSVPPAGLKIVSSHLSTFFTEGFLGATYELTISNATSAVRTSSIVYVTDTVPAGLTLVSMAGFGWSCSGNLCFRADALQPGASYPQITVTVNIAINAPSTVTNQAAVTGGGSPSASASDPTTIGPGLPPAPVTIFSPAQGATGVALNVTLSWQPASLADSYNVYLGTTKPPALVASGLTGTTYTPASPLNAGTTYYWMVTSVNGFSSTASAVWSFTTVAPATAGLGFVPVTPCRILDTRGATGPFGGPSIPAGSTRNITIPQSSCNIPATAQAYSLNITVVPAAVLGYLTVWPAGQTQPLVSTLNSYAGQIVANAAIVPAGTGGAISVYVSDTTDVIIDIDGYFAPISTAGALSFYAATPCRVADTRTKSVFAGPSLAAGETRKFAILSGPCSIPATAQAYSLNITVVPSEALEYLTIWPTGQSQPVVSTLNSPNGSIAANAALVPAGNSGDVSVFVTGATDVIIDIDGYFAPPGSAGPFRYTR